MRSSARSYASPTCSIPSLRAASMKRADCSGSSGATSVCTWPLEGLAMDESTGERKPLEALDDLIDHIRHISEHARNRVTLEGLSVSERYIEGALWVLVDFECVEPRSRGHYIAILHRKTHKTYRDFITALI